MVLKGVARCYTVLQIITGCYTVPHVVTGCYIVLQGVTMYYTVLHSVTRCYTANAARFRDKVFGFALCNSVMKVKCLAQEHNTLTPARTRTRTTHCGVQCTNR